jgi:hypothetical protein
VNKLLAITGAIAVAFMTALMLFTADAYLWEYPSWAWWLIWTAAIGLCANALAKPQTALSPPAIMVSAITGLALAWPVTVGGESWRPVWLALGIAMPLLGCWLLKSFSLAFRKA